MKIKFRFSLECSAKLAPPWAAVIAAFLGIR